MPAEVDLTPFSVHPGGPTAPGQFVVRFNDNVVRADGGLPLLFPTHGAAENKAKALKEAYHG